MNVRIVFIAALMALNGCMHHHQQAYVVPRFDSLDEAEWQFTPISDDDDDVDVDLDQFATVVFFPFFASDFRYRSNPKKFSNADVADFKAHLTVLGVDFPPGSQISVREDHELIVTNTIRNLRRLRGIQTVTCITRAQVKVSFLLIAFESAQQWSVEEPGNLARLLLQAVERGAASIVARNEVVTHSGNIVVSEINGTAVNRLELTPTISADGVTIDLDFRWQLQDTPTGERFDGYGFPIDLQNAVGACSGTPIVVSAFSSRMPAKNEESPMKLFVVIVPHVVDFWGRDVEPLRRRRTGH